MNPRPLIGVTACRRDHDGELVHVVVEKYLTAVEDCSGLPVMIPALGGGFSIDDLLPRLDGVVVTGSLSNVEPHHYNGPISVPGTDHDPARDATTLRLIPAVVDAGIPLLAICRGLQETNVALGGTLHQRVQEVPGFRCHYTNQDEPWDVQFRPSHDVHFAKGGLLQRLTGVSTAMVNSLHEQAVDRLAPGLTVEAVADDGLVEAFTVDRATSFALAVQWHPEWKVREHPVYLAIFQAFGEACRGYAETRDR